MLALVIVRELGLVTSIRALVVHDIMGIKPKGTEVISSPDINYGKDIKSIDSVIKMLEEKKRNALKKDGKKGENNKTTQ